VAFVTCSQIHDEKKILCSNLEYLFCSEKTQIILRLKNKPGKKWAILYPFKISIFPSGNVEN